MTYGQPYATCSACRQPFAITKGGNIYPHNGPRGGRCSGAGRLPLKDHRLGYPENVRRNLEAVRTGAMVHDPGSDAELRRLGLIRYNAVGWYDLTPKGRAVLAGGAE